MRPLIVCLILFLIQTSSYLLAQSTPDISIPISIRTEFKLDPFYQKFADANGLPVVGSAKVSTNALNEAAFIVKQMLGHRPDIIQAMKETKVRIAVMAANEYTTDIPEHSKLTPKLFWDRRARGLGTTPSNPAASCGEENLLGFPRDPYPNENIFIHEFAHAIHLTGLNKIDPTFDQRLQASFKAALDRGLWKNTYAASNPGEYWAEGTQSWFDDNAPPDALHNDIRTRDKLKLYDPALALLCKEVFGDLNWRYLRPAYRKANDQAHLFDYNPKKLPQFTWRFAPLIDKPKVTMQTELGDFDILLDAVAAPQASETFLKIALEGGYHSGKFHLVSQQNQKPQVGWIEAQVNPSWKQNFASNIKLKELSPSKIPFAGNTVTENTIALLQNKSNPGAFIILLGAPSTPNPNFIPFGKVVKNSEVIAKILDGKTNGITLIKPVDIKRVIRTE